MNFEQLQEHVRSQLVHLSTKWDADPSAALTRQLEHVKARTYDVEFPLLKARQFIPVASDADPAAHSILHQQWTQFGAARIMADLADDIPLVSVAVREFSTPVVSTGIGYHYTVQELRESSKTGAQLDTRRAIAARRGAEVTLDQIAAFGDSRVGLTGFLNHPNVPLVTLSNGTWATATPQEVLEDLYQLEESIIDATEENHAATSLLVPGSIWKIIRTTQMTTTGENTDTILQTFLRGAQSVREADRWAKLETADAAGTGPRIVMYEKSPDVMTLEIPQDLEQFPPQAVNLAFKVPMHMRVGGVRMTYPLAVAYADNAG